MSSSLAGSLDEELSQVASERVHALPSVVAERFASIRYGLDRVNELHCDGYATEDSPVNAGTPIEVKAVRVQHHDGTGRLNVHVDSHESLLEERGRYAIVVYADVEHAGEQRIVALACELVSAEVVDCYVERGDCSYQKVGWPKLLDEDAVDVARWSA